MKSIAELKALRDSVKDTMGIRHDNDAEKKIVVGMATCGIAAGAREVLTAIIEEVEKKNLQHVAVAQSGCNGQCQNEPIVEVFEAGKEKVTYIKVTPDKAKKIVDEHLANGKPVVEYTK